MFRSIRQVLCALVFFMVATSALGASSPIEVFACMRTEVKAGASTSIHITVREPGTVTADHPFRYRTAGGHGTSSSVDVPRDASMLTVFPTRDTVFTLTVGDAVKQLTITVTP